MGNREQEKEREQKREKGERVSNKTCLAHKKYTESQFNVFSSFKTTGVSQNHFPDKYIYIPGFQNLSFKIRLKNNRQTR